MNPAGIVLAIAGIWVISQVFAGNALERMNIIKPAPAESKDGGGWVPGLPDPGDIPGVPGLPVPGSKSNPPFIDFGKIFGGSSGYGRAL